MIELNQGHSRYTINPFRGASSCHWSINGSDILYIDKSSYRSKAIKFKGGNPITFPIFSTLNLDGSEQCLYDGKKVSLPQHGLARLSNRWRANQVSENIAKLYLSHDQETLALYPYEFEFEVEFHLFEDGLRLTQKVRNPSSTSLPFVTGFHPYFKVSDPLNCEISGLLPGTPCFALPNAGPFDFSAHLPQQLPLGREEINHHMVTGSRKITLKDRLSTRRIGLHPSGAFPCLTVWSEPGQPFICLEPTSGRRGAFETHENLNVLPAGEEWIGQVEIVVEA